MATVDFDCAVIGAGVSGLVATKTFLEKGLSVVCLEKSSDVGGLWNFSEEGYGVMRFTHINVSKNNYVYSDFPFPDDTPDFPHHSDMMEYLRSYCRRFNLLDYILTDCIVVNIEPVGELWKINFEKGKFQSYQGSKSITVRHVAVATGHHTNPSIPTIKGESTYTGIMFHSLKYKCATSSEILGKRVLVVGIGNSAVDVADNAVTEGRCPVTLSVRTPAWIFSPYLFGCPMDHYATRAIYTLPLRAVEMIVQTLICLVQGLPEKWGLFPQHPILRSQPTVSHTLLHHIQRGKIKLKPEIANIGPGKRVVFTDGTEAAYDVICLATGYTIGVPFVKKCVRDDIVVDSNEINLYKNVFSPKYGHSLGFIGFIQPSSGGLMTCSEMQSRWMAELAVGAVSLPDSRTMQNVINSDKQWERSWYYKSKRLTIQKTPLLYNEEIADMIGCKPQLFKDLSLTWNLLFTVSAFQWRLFGRSSWAGAKAACLKIQPVPFYHYSAIFLLALLGIILLGFIKNIITLMI